MNLNQNRVADSSARPSSDVERFRVFEGFNAPRQCQVLLGIDRPQSDVFRRIAVCIATMAALLATEVQAIPVRCCDVTTLGATSAGVLGVDLLSLDSDSRRFVGNLELSAGIRPPAYFRAEVFPFAERRIADVAQIFHDDFSRSIRDGVAHQGFRCNVQQVFCYGSFVATHATKKAMSGASANSLNCATVLTNRAAHLFQVPAVEEKCFGVGRVGGDHHPLDAEVATNDATFGLEFGNFDFVREAQIPDLADSFQFGIFPAGFRDGWVLQGESLTENCDAFLVASKVALVSQWHGGAFEYRQIPFAERLQGLVAAGDVPEQRASQLRWELELLADGGIEGAGQSIRVEFLRFEHALRSPASSSQIPDGESIQMLGLPDLNLDCSSRFQYVSISHNVLSLSSAETTTGSDGLKAVVSDPTEL